MFVDVDKLEGLIGWLMDWLEIRINSLFGWLINWLVTWLVDCPQSPALDWLPDWLIDWRMDWLNDGWIDCRMDGLKDWSNAWLKNWLKEEWMDWRIDRLIEGLFKGLIAWIEGLIDWLVDCPQIPTPCPYVKEMKDAGMFYANRVLKDYKEKWVLPPSLTRVHCVCGVYTVQCAWCVHCTPYSVVGFFSL